MSFQLTHIKELMEWVCVVRAKQEKLLEREEDALWPLVLLTNSQATVEKEFRKRSETQPAKLEMLRQKRSSTGDGPTARRPCNTS